MLYHNEMPVLPAIPTRGKRLLFARELVPGRTQSHLAEKCGVTVQAVSGWENTGKVSTDHLLTAADFYGVPFDWLQRGGLSLTLDETGGRPFGGKRVPVISYVQAGMWRRAEDPYSLGAWDTYLVPDKQVGDLAFALEIQGDSMEPVFRAGDHVIIDPGVEPRPGDFVVAMLKDDGEATFKVYRPRGMSRGRPTEIELVPLNENWPVLTMSKKRPGEIIGTMIEHRKYRR